MTKTIEIVERINSHANSWERDDALDAREPTEEARFWRETALTIEALAKALEMIADIGEGSTTANSLPNIAKIARSELQKLYGGNNEG